MLKTTYSLSSSKALCVSKECKVLFLSCYPIVQLSHFLCVCVLIIEIASFFLFSQYHLPSNKIIYANCLLCVLLCFSWFHKKICLLIPVHIYPFMYIQMYINNNFYLILFLIWVIITGVELLVREYIPTRAK